MKEGPLDTLEKYTKLREEEFDEYAAKKMVKKVGCYIIGLDFLALLVFVSLRMYIYISVFVFNDC